MREDTKWVGLATVAICAVTIFGLSQQSTKNSEFYSAVETKPIAAALPTVSYTNSRVQYVPRPLQAVPEYVTEGVVDDKSSESFNLGTPLMSLALFPLAAAIGYFAGKRNQKPSLGPLDLSVGPHTTYSMLSTAAEGSAEAAKPSAAVETSYAKIIQSIEKKYLKDDVPNIRIGDTVTVGVRIKEGDKERVQDYTGVVISMRNGGLHRSITVRAVLQGIGVERNFPVHAPQVAFIKVLKNAKVRRAKLFFLRGRSGKAARLKQRFPKVSKA